MENIDVTAVPEDAYLIDVREPEEYERVHARDAINIPLSELPLRHDEIDGEKTAYIICRSGGRSVQAIGYLSQLGFDNLVNVEGGTRAWVDAQLPVVGDPADQD